jgi:hypothetical protein
MSQITGTRAGLPALVLASHQQNGLFDASSTFTLRFPAAEDDRGTL